MPKDDGLYVGHMIEMAEKAVGLVKNRTRDDFDRDEALALACTDLVQVIGEAARRVSSEYVAAHPRIPWRAIVGMRHRVVHDYLSVDMDLVWDVITVDLPELLRELKEIRTE